MLKCIHDRRVLKAICKRYNFILDDTYSYIIKSDYVKSIIYKDNEYKLEYVSGCFHPYIMLVVN